MPTSFFQAHKDVYELVAKVMYDHHRSLHDAGMTIDCVMAESCSKRGPQPAIKVQGYPRAAVIKITPLEERARGAKDVKLKIDGNEWLRLSAPQREALVDHELQHIDLNPTRATKKRSARTTDDLGRPRLKIRPHDYELMGFRDVIERNGENSLESIGIHRFSADFQQLELFPRQVKQAA